MYSTLYQMAPEEYFATLPRHSTVVPSGITPLEEELALASLRRWTEPVVRR